MGYTCRFCHKHYINNCYYYVHLKTQHVTPETMHMFSNEEMELINKYYNKRLNYDRKSYKKRNDLCKNMDVICPICNHKYKNIKVIRRHMIVSHDVYDDEVEHHNVEHHNAEQHNAELPNEIFISDTDL